MRCLNVRLMGLLACTAAANATNTKAANAGRGEGTIVQHGSTPQASTPCVKATMRILYGGDRLRHNKGTSRHNEPGALSWHVHVTR